MESKFLLISDGTSDKALIPIIEYTLSIQFPDIIFTGQRADFNQLLRYPKNLEERIIAGTELYGYNLMFIHRDAEKEHPVNREVEIDNAINNIKAQLNNKQILKIIPVRMTEAWLLIDEMAIRKASGNPNGKIAFSLPQLRKLEKLPDPKKKLESLILLASELKGRRAKNLNLRKGIQLVSQYIDDFSPLMNLEAYKKFLGEVKAINL